MHERAASVSRMIMGGVRAWGCASDTDVAVYNHRSGDAWSTYWAPVINLAREPRWGRNIETPGEVRWVRVRCAVQLSTVVVRGVYLCTVVVYGVWCVAVKGSCVWCAR